MVSTVLVGRGGRSHPWCPRARAGADLTRLQTRNRTATHLAPVPPPPPNSGWTCVPRCALHMVNAVDLVELQARVTNGPNVNCYLPVTLSPEDSPTGQLCGSDHECPFMRAEGLGEGGGFLAFSFGEPPDSQLLSFVATLQTPCPF